VLGLCGVAFQACNQIFLQIVWARYRLELGDTSNLEFEMTRLALLALAALAAAGGALADPPVTATTPQSQPVAATIPQPSNVNGGGSISNYGSLADTKMICKTVTPTGSRLGGKRVCMTKADWEKQSRSAQDYMNTRLGAPSH
jgi:hypothetical protein